jgi:predicted Fe-Mo cluster-binding NifX family protein
VFCLSCCFYTAFIVLCVFYQDGTHLGLMRRMGLSTDSRDMRVGVTARGDSPLSEVCGQFGRAYWLMIYSPADRRWYAIDNDLNRTRSNNAGIGTAETMIAAGVKIVLTGETGPKAFRTLKAAGISVVHNVSGIVDEALSDWLSGHLPLAALANDSGSPNCLLGPQLSQRPL